MNSFGDFGDADEAARIIREANFDYAIQDGKVYVSAEQFGALYKRVSNLLLLQSVLRGGDPTIYGASKGMDVASLFVREVQSDLLRREAEAIVGASDTEG